MSRDSPDYWPVRWLSLAVIVLLGVSLRLVHFNSEIDGDFAFRQVHVMSDIISLKQDWDGAPLAPLERFDRTWVRSVRVFDTPVYQFVAARISDWTGWSALSSARLLNLAIYGLTVLLLATLLLRIGLGMPTAWLAALVYSISPLTIQYQIGVLPDNLVMLFGLTSLHAFVRFQQGGGAPAYALLVLSGALAAVIKPPIQFTFALTVAGVVALREGLRSWLRPVWLGYFGLLLAVVAAYSLITTYINWGSFSDPNREWYFGTLAQRRDPLLWWAMAERLVYLFGHPVLGGFFVLGLLLGLRRLRREPGLQLLYIWLLAGLVTVAVFFNVNVIHNYYQLPYVLPYSVFCACGLHALLSRLDRLALFFGRWMRLAGMALLIVSLGILVRYSFKTPVLDYHYNDFYQRIGRDIARVTPERAFVVYTADFALPADLKYLYYARRHGLLVDPDYLSGSLLYAVIEQFDAPPDALYLYWHAPGGLGPVGQLALQDRTYPFRPVRTLRDDSHGVVMRMQLEEGRSFDLEAELLAELRALRAHSRWLGQGAFEVYHDRDDNRLVLARTGCTPDDLRLPFFLHLYPAVPDDIRRNRDQDFQNLDFDFARHGVRAGGLCVAERQLPAYRLAALHVGQFEGPERTWQLLHRFDTGDE